MPTIKLWNTELGHKAPYEVSTDQNGDLLCTYQELDVEDVIKFPGGLSKAEFTKLVDAHNEANKGMKAVDPSDVEKTEERDDKNQKLLDSL